MMESIVQHPFSLAMQLSFIESYVRKVTPMTS